MHPHREEIETARRQSFRRMSKEIYLKRVIEQIPRLLTQQDRCEDSPTYGCFDRSYWHYKIQNFPCARYQEASYTLALLYSIKSNINPYYKNEKIRRWAIAGMNFWKKINAGDEWYFNEHSFVSTSFSTLAVMEVYNIFKLNDAEIEEAIVKSLKWIERHDEPLVANQLAGSILALDTYLARKPLYGVAYDTHMFQERLDKLLSSQNEEGWFSEYGGFDVGYSYILLDYLARLWKNSKDKRDAADKLIEFLSYFIHPDGTTGGIYTSRQTTYIIPSGLEIFSENPIARAIADIELKNLQERPILWDDRYLCYQLYYHLIAYLNHKKTKPAKLPYQKMVGEHFSESGLHVNSDGKGNYIIKNDDGRFVVYEDYKLSLCSKLQHSKSHLMNPYTTILMNIFQLTFGRSDIISKFVKKKLRQKLILNKKGKSNIYVPSARYFNKNELRWK